MVIATAMANLTQKLQSLAPKVQEIQKVSGTTGISVGIIYQGKSLLTQHFGYRNVEKKLPPDDETIYYLASLSKSFTAAAIALLIQQGKLSWDVPLSQVPIKKPFEHKDPEICQHATILDFLSHRTGLAPKNHLWSQEFGHMSLRRGETIRTVAYLEKIAPFRSRWIYSNWGYGVADVLIDELAGLSWSQYLQTYIFNPLGMKRTKTEIRPRMENVAEGYMALPDGNPYWVGEPEGEDGDVIEGALAVKSCVKDLMKYYLTFLSALEQARQPSGGPPVETPFVDAEVMVHPHIKLSTESANLDGSYGLGWVNAQLPCTLGAIGLNPAFVDKMPVVGKGLKEKVNCIYHQGSANSFLSSVYLLPDSHSGVVVLTNSMSKNDAADWLGELYLQAILDNPEPNDYVQIAKKSAEAAMNLWPAMRKELDEGQIKNTPVRPFEQYVGKYYNIIGNYHLEIFIENDCLNLRFQRERRLGYKLTHYHFDTFSWLLTYEADVHVGRFPISRASFYLLHFKSDQDDKTKVTSVVWAHDDEVPEGETFFKRDAALSDRLEPIVKESQAVPPDITAFDTDKIQSRDPVRPFPVDADTFRREGMAKDGVLVETELESLTKGVSNDGDTLLNTTDLLKPKS